ncbi:NAD(P)H nitroreductase [Mergibacter septicus]|uniref:Putative NAD(P)H nitroreductase n=1 Tax=Mergibacter septicus TaxID=221402 RepID=A0A8E3SA65_9PAST|nr:NAD(P)H nitroreductase [Mergibacter septicus]AWX15721.1 NAD(P)H nitroreductase [Mergibacter septicus]QDJ14974.1 NAD(P)H nitroreductase [Mergibacter septicus]UTU47601.1 NAD(P)H nitroreductase [Mergibacter septicus]WMR96793.1 NAD(P)H nitroreductase [Mergibacter septicus]
MDALDLLLNRRSEKKLTYPAPQGEQLQTILQAGLQAPDHGRLTPYRFVVIEKNGLKKLEECFKDAVIEFGLGEERLKKAESLPQRAPMFIAVIAKLNAEIKKVPTWEQMLSAGCATYSLQLAANALGFANVWITGNWVEGRALRYTLKCSQQEKIIALLMLGTAEKQEKYERSHKGAEISDIVSYLH